MKKISCCFSEIRLLSYGASAGDLEVTKYSRATERVSPLIPVPHGLPLHNNAIYNSLYVSHLQLFMCCRAVLYCKFQEFRPPLGIWPTINILQIIIGKPGAPLICPLLLCFVIIFRKTGPPSAHLYTPEVYEISGLFNQTPAI